MPGALREDALQVSVTRDGSIFFDKMKVAKGDLPALLEQAVKEGSERKVYLRVDARAKYGDAKAVLEQVRLAGIENVALMTEELRHKSPL